MKAIQIDVVEVDLNARFAAQDAERASFNGAMGRMVLAFSDVEAAITKVLLFYTKLENKVGRALVSGMHASNFVDALRSLIENGVIVGARADDLKQLLSQVSALNTGRNFLVHYGSARRCDFDADLNMHISDIGRKNKTSKGVVYAFNSKVVGSMATDLQVIEERLEYHLRVPRRKRFVPFDSPAFYAPWRYKSPQQVPMSRRLHVARE